MTRTHARLQPSATHRSAYPSRALLAAERALSTGEREQLAVHHPHPFAAVDQDIRLVERSQADRCAQNDVVHTPW
jgi:hypothetical protein